MVQNHDRCGNCCYCCRHSAVAASLYRSVVHQNIPDSDHSSLPDSAARIGGELDSACLDNLRYIEEEHRMAGFESNLCHRKVDGPVFYVVAGCNTCDLVSDRSRNDELVTYDKRKKNKNAASTMSPTATHLPQVYQPLLQ